MAKQDGTVSLKDEKQLFNDAVLIGKKTKDLEELFADTHKLLKNLKNYYNTENAGELIEKYNDVYKKSAGIIKALKSYSDQLRNVIKTYDEVEKQINNYSADIASKTKKKNSSVGALSESVFKETIKETVSDINKEWK